MPKTTPEFPNRYKDPSAFLKAYDEDSRLFALYRVSSALGSSLDLDEVLNQVMDSVINLTGAERGFLILLEPTTGELKLRAGRNIEQETLEHKDMEVSRSLIKAVLENGEGVVTTDAQTDPRFKQHQSVFFYALRSIMCAPLRARGRDIGAVYVENRAQKGHFVRADLDLLEAFAIQAAIAIENARLYTQTDQALSSRVTELETITLIDRQLNAHLELDAVLDLSRRWAIKGAQATECWLALQDKETGQLEVLAGPVGAPLDHPLVGKALGGTAGLASAGEDAPPFLLVVPLLLGGKTTGILLASRMEPFSADSLPFLERLANRSAIAVQNALLYRAVQTANEYKSKFISVVTHELRIPMTSIKGYTDLLLKGIAGPVNDGQAKFLSVIRNNTERMAELVGDLSDISRIETGRLKLEMGSVQVDGCLQETVASLGPRLLEKNHQLEIDLPSSLPPVHADPNRLVQVLTNLLSNAEKYTLPGGRIAVRVQPCGGRLRFEVADNGVGISPEDQAKLFTQFFRSEDPDVRLETGWGLGLHVTKLLVELMGGEIGVQSVLDQGSTFWLTLSVYEG